MRGAVDDGVVAFRGIPRTAADRAAAVRAASAAESVVRGTERSPKQARGDADSGCGPW
jgi:hypothetical protein